MHKRLTRLVTLLSLLPALGLAAEAVPPTPPVAVQTLHSLTQPLGAPALAAQQFQDQWGKALGLSAETRLLIISRHKDGGEWVRNALTELGISDLQGQHWLYVADIARMPRLITKMFALPAMRDYSFPVALVQDEQLIADWPTAANQVVVLNLDNLRVRDRHDFADQQSLQGYLQDLLQNRQNAQ